MQFSVEFASTATLFHAVQVQRKMQKLEARLRPNDGKDGDQDAATAAERPEPERPVELPVEREFRKGVS